MVNEPFFIMTIFDLFYSYASSQPDFKLFNSVKGQYLNFDKGSLHFYFYSDASVDPYYFRIMLPVVEKITETNKDSVERRCVAATTSIKVGKALIIGDAVWFSAEQFLYDLNNPQYISLLFDRLILVLQTMLDNYNSNN